MSNVSFLSQKLFSSVSFSPVSQCQPRQPVSAPSASVSPVSQCQPRQPVSAPSTSVSPVSQKVILPAVSGFAEVLKLKNSLSLILLTNSKSFYYCLVKLDTITEKKLMIDLMCLRQFYERREIAEIR